MYSHTSLPALRRGQAPVLPAARRSSRHTAGHLHHTQVCGELPSLQRTPPLRFQLLSRCNRNLRWAVQPSPPRRAGCLGQFVQPRPPAALPAVPRTHHESLPGPRLSRALAQGLDHWISSAAAPQTFSGSATEALNTSPYCPSAGEEAAARAGGRLPAQGRPSHRRTAPPPPARAASLPSSPMARPHGAVSQTNTRSSPWPAAAPPRRAGLPNDGSDVPRPAAAPVKRPHSGTTRSNAAGPRRAGRAGGRGCAPGGRAGTGLAPSLGLRLCGARGRARAGAGGSGASWVYRGRWRERNPAMFTLLSHASGTSGSWSLDADVGRFSTSEHFFLSSKILQKAGII